MSKELERLALKVIRSLKHDLNRQRNKSNDYFNLILPYCDDHPELLKEINKIEQLYP